MDKEIILDIMKANIVELLCMPLFLYTYTPDLLFFWILLILMDSYIIKHQHIIEVMKNIEAVSKKNQRTLHILSFGIVIAIVIIAFKNIKLAGYLLLNDIALDGMSALYDLNRTKK